MQPAGKKTPEGKPIGNDVTADLAIRKAINIGIDRKKLSDGVLGGYGTPAWGGVDNRPGDNPEQRLPDGDLAAAKAPLDKAGWVEKDGKRSKGGRQARFTLLHPAMTTPVVGRIDRRHGQATGHPDRHRRQELI